MSDFVERYKAARSEDAQRALLTTATQEERDALAEVLGGSIGENLRLGKTGHPHDWRGSRFFIELPPAANLIEHVLPPQTGLRQWVLTIPFAWRRRLAQDGHCSAGSRASP